MTSCTSRKWINTHHFRCLVQVRRDILTDVIAALSLLVLNSITCSSPPSHPALHKHASNQAHTHTHTVVTCECVHRRTTLIYCNLCLDFSEMSIDRQPCSCRRAPCLSSKPIQRQERRSRRYLNFHAGARLCDGRELFSLSVAQKQKGSLWRRGY